MPIYRLCYHGSFDTARSFFDFLTATDFQQLTISWQFINMALQSCLANAVTLKSNHRNLRYKNDTKVNKDNTLQRGIPQVTVEICHFQVKNNCLRDYKHGAEHTP